MLGSVCSKVQTRLALRPTLEAKWAKTLFWAAMGLYEAIRPGVQLDVCTPVACSPRYGPGWIEARD